MSRARAGGFTDLPVDDLHAMTLDQRAFLVETLLMVEDPDARRMVPLIPNAMQRSILGSLTDYEIVVKWRRAGLTSIYCADAWIDLVTRPGVNVELFAHNDKTAKAIFEQIVLRQYESIPDEVRPRADRSTVNSLVFKDIGSKFVVGTAGQSIHTATSGGQARTINILICTEFAFYAYAEEFLAKAENCVPVRGGKIRIDSTPNGHNSFRDRFIAARAGHSRFTPRFFPWWYSERCALPLDRGEGPNDLHGHGPITGEELALGHGNPHADSRFGPDRLTSEQIKWRRWKIRDTLPLGNLTARDRFRVEFPEDADSCFLHSGRPLFMPDDLVIRCEAEKPRRGHQYTIGMDTSTGSAHGHPAGIVVLDVSTSPARQVYEWCGWASTDMQAEHVVDLQTRYRDAWIVVERNYPGDSVLQLLRRWGTTFVYKHRDKELREGAEKSRSRKPGFPMTGTTKPRLFTELQSALNNRELLLSGDQTIADLKGMQYDDDDSIVYKSSGERDRSRGITTHGELAIAAALAWHGRKSGGPGVA